MAVSGAFHTPFMAPARDRLRAALAERRPPGARPARVRQRRRPGPHRRRRVGRPARRPAVQPGALAPDARTTSRRPASRTFVELGPGSVLTGMAKRTVTGARTLSVATPDELDRLLEALAAPGRRGRSAPTRASTSSPPSAIVVSPAAGVFHPADGVGAGHARWPPATCSARSATTPVHSPFAGTIMGMLTDRGRAGHQPRAHRLARGSASMAGRRASPAGAPPCPDKIVTNADLEATLDTTDAWITERTGIRERRIGGTTVGAGHRGRAGRAGPGRRSTGRHRPGAASPPARPTRPCRPPPPTVQDALGIRGGAVRRQRGVLRLRLRPGPSPAGMVATGHRPGAAHRGRHHEPHHRLGRPQHRHPVRRRRRRGRARGHRRTRATCSPTTSTPTAPARHLLHGRHRRLHARWTAARCSAGPCARRSTRRCARSSPGRRRRRRHRPVRAPPGQHPHHRRGLRSASASRSSAPSSPSTATATPPRRRSRWPWPRPPTPAASATGDLVLLVGFGAGMSWASAVRALDRPRPERTREPSP